jgi:hypothetical protein
MKNLHLYFASYYVVILAFISFLFSVSLWFTGHELEGIFVGIWVPSILSLSIVLRNSKNDFNKLKNNS